MIELFEHRDGSLTRAFGGDTLNTALYLARLGVPTDYVTALGDDAFSDEMVAAWASEGIGTEFVIRVPGRLPGLYLIRTDPSGERSFHHWRDSAPVRQLFQLPGARTLLDGLCDFDLVYLSGITLSLFTAEDRERLFATLEQVRRAGGRIAFDANYRPRGWPDQREARLAYERAFRTSDIVLASVEDHASLYGAMEPERLIRRLLDAEVAESVVKLSRPACYVLTATHRELIEAPPVSNVVDTTAAGDSFAAGYLAARRAGYSPAKAARTGHELAGTVVRYRGAIIAKAAMPELQISPRSVMSHSTTSVANLLRAARLVAVLTIERAEDAVPLARALVAGGVRTLEITLRTEAAAEAAAAIHAEVKDAVVGLGTITTPKHLELAKRLGLPFAFSPGADSKLLDAAVELGVPFVPGVATASELIAAVARGFSTVKLFPAELVGGIPMIKALSGPFPAIQFNPTGGVNEANFGQYLELPNVVAVGGSWLAPAADVAAGRWDTITARAARAMALLA